ncbi:MAG: mechanosensitive ion channel family protein, partial [Flavobacteriales bacterium]
VKRTKVEWDDILLEKRVFARLAHIFPALILQYYIAILFPDNQNVTKVIVRFLDAWVILVFMNVLIAVINVFDHYVKDLNSLKNKPTSSYFQLFKIIIYFFGGILIIARIFDKDPVSILATFGALTAVMMLVFKDTILGFVASVQIAANDMIRTGDWISFPKYGADGTVLDITLNTVKIQNWDKTITTVPTYALVSDSFKNWRGMSESEARRIKRSIIFSASSVSYCSDVLLDELEQVDILSGFLKERRAEISTFNEQNKVNTDLLINGRRLTNLGLFRYYAQNYITNHEGIHPDFTQMVFQLAQNDQGIPIQIYCFTNTIEWKAYEDIQSDIFDHLFASAPLFGLEIFQQPSSSDFQKLTTN